MVRPANFNFNEETAHTNDFQNNDDASNPEISQKAILEFDEMVKILQQNGIKVTVWQDTYHPERKDAVFPNNWVSFHQNGQIFVYPMLVPSRRLERNIDFFKQLENDFLIHKIQDYSFWENEGLILEGTGSMVFDYVHRKIYASLSPRTHAKAVLKFAEIINFEPILFQSFDSNKNSIYHTNVVLTIGSGFAIICMEAIHLENRKFVVDSFLENKLEIIEITLDQMNHFAGNAVELQNHHEKILVLSSTANNALFSYQKEILQKFVRLVPVEIPTIEKYGGGSARCMIAVNFLPLSQ